MTDLHFPKEFDEIEIRCKSEFHIKQENGNGSVTPKRVALSDVIWKKFHASHWNTFLPTFSVSQWEA